MTRPASTSWAVELRSPSRQLEAAFLPQVGMIGWSFRHRGDDLLSHPVDLSTYIETGEPTALALLHPWANRLASPEFEIAGRRVALDLSAPHLHTDPNGLPIHGLVAGLPNWELVERLPSRLRARLDFEALDDLLAQFPFPHMLELTVELADDRLAVDVRLTPTSDSPVPVAFGFHPYLRLPHLGRQQWFVELPVTSRVLLDDHKLPTGQSEPVQMRPGPLGDRTFDDHFDGFADPSEFALTGAGRRVALRFVEGYRFAQVYAPPGSDFISFEPMTAPINPFDNPRTLLVEPGADYVARFEITVEDFAERASRGQRRTRAGAPSQPPILSGKHTTKYAPGSTSPRLRPSTTATP
jgi:aldose 1-epimerase